MGLNSIWEMQKRQIHFPPPSRRSTRADSHQQPARERCRGRVPDGQSALNLAAARLRYIAGLGVVDQKISEHRVAEGSADERCHHRVSQGGVPLSQTESAKDSGHYPIPHVVQGLIPDVA
jgi:hypothetical protein